MTKRFDPALALLADAEKRGVPHTERLEWSVYKSQYGVSCGRTTADAISIQNRRGLRPELEAAQTMVLRVGRGTFQLVRASNGVADFFLDAQPPKGEPIVRLAPQLSLAESYLFRTLGVSSEINLVQYAAIGGVFGHALGLDEPDQRVAPTMIHGNHQFSFRPLASRADIVLDHHGQVQIDGIFIAERGGQPMCFVIEAKRAAKPTALAKHKLVFALHALAERLQTAEAASPYGDAIVPFVPAYLRAWPGGGRTQFEIVECQACMPDGIPAVDELHPVSRYRCEI